MIRVNGSPRGKTIHLLKQYSLVLNEFRTTQGINFNLMAYLLMFWIKTSEVCVGDIKLVSAVNSEHSKP